MPASQATAIGMVVVGYGTLFVYVAMEYGRRLVSAKRERDA